MAVLPNFEIRESIETSKAAFATACDPRVREIIGIYSNFGLFLDSFEDAFGNNVRPTILLLNPKASKRFKTVNAVASLRDILGASIIPRARSRAIQELPFPGVTYSNSFDFYPWMVDKDYKHLIGITPALRALHEVRKFKGQPLPEVARMAIDTSALDAPLFNELTRRWVTCYSRTNVAWTDLALMRSLNMAYQASKLPAGLDATYLDDGRLIGLWISAFEILVHPGVGHKSNQRKVMSMLESCRWKFRRNNIRNIGCKIDGKIIKKALPSYLYYKLNKARNDFFHGEPVSRKSILLPKIGRSVEHFAAPLYRMALTAFLDLHWKGQLPPIEDSQAFARACCDQWEFEKPQGEVEKAIVLSRGGRI